MCKRVSLERAAKIGALPEDYLKHYGVGAYSITCRVFENYGQYFIEDPLRDGYRQISSEVYRILNSGLRRPKRPSRRTK
jgi:hypothetical protein